MAVTQDSPTGEPEDIRLPENAFRELKPGETYQPVIPASQDAPEVTTRSIVQIFRVALLGAILGVLLLAPFRGYFVRDLHGKMPFPEAHATTEILVAGKRGGRSAIVLTYSALGAAAFDFLSSTMHTWSDT